MPWPCKRIVLHFELNAKKLRHSDYALERSISSNTVTLLPLIKATGLI
jgi:hypothetical protein